VFEKSQLGQKGVVTLMSELLSRNVCRLKDDMSVITFSDSSPGDCVSLPCSTNLTSSDDLTTEIVETSSARGGKEKEKV
jgi:hypothetical protein